MEKVSLAEKFERITEHWSPKIAGELNDAYIKLAKLVGEFLWHRHDAEDEMFLVVKGSLTIRFRDRDILLGEGEFLIIPKGIEHMPVAEREVWVMLIESKTTRNTGEVQNERTVETLDWV